MIFKLFCYQKRWFCHDLCSNSHMTLLDESNRLLHCLSILQRTQKHSQTSSAKCWHWYFLCRLDVFPWVDNSHVVQFLEQLLSGLDSELIIRGKELNLRNQGSDHSTDFVVMVVIVSVLEVVLVDDFGFAFVGFDFPVVEVDFLEEFLLMVL